MSRAKQSRPSQLLIVLAILATLVSPSGMALVAVAGPEMPEAVGLVLPEILPLAPNMASVAKNPQPLAIADDPASGSGEKSGTHLDQIESDLPDILQAQPAAAAAADANIRYVRTDGSDTGDCLQSSAPCASIQYAINVAVSGDTIWIDPGTYRETVIIGKNLDLVRWQNTAGLVVVDGESSRQGVQILHNPSDPNILTVTISGVSIINGFVNGYSIFGLAAGIEVGTEAMLTLIDSNVSDNVSRDFSGGISLNQAGGIYNRGTVTLINSSVSNNQAIPVAHSKSFIAGGIYNATGSTLTLINSSVDNNSVSYNSSGIDNAPRLGGGIYNNGTIAITNNSSIRENSALATRGIRNQSIVGGGIYNAIGGTLTVDQSSIRDNKAEVSYGDENINMFGGGIYSSGTVTLTNSIVQDNTAKAIVGTQNLDTFSGGIYSSGTATLSNSAVQENMANILGGLNNSVLFGGGIYNEIGMLILDHSSISRNTVDGSANCLRCTATSGGGIYNARLGTVTLTHSTIGENSANQQGGGIFNAAGATVSLDNSDVISNTTDQGGGIYNGGTANVTNSIVGRNRAASYGGGLYNGGTVNVTNSTIGENNAGQQGGGVWNVGTLNARFTTLYANSAPAGLNLYVVGNHNTTLYATVVAPADNSPSGSANCVVTGVAIGGSYNRVTDHSCLLTNGTDNIEDAIVLLEPLAYNGGATLNYLPTPREDNDILDAVHPDQCLGLKVDQRGRARPISWSIESTKRWCDGGAVEFSLSTHFVCGSPLWNGTDFGAFNLRCSYTTIAAALQQAVEDDTVVISGVITESVVVSKSVTFRGPSATEMTPGTHMGFVQAGPTAPTDGSGSAPIFTIATGTRVTIEELNIRNGSSADGGAINNAGDLDLKGVTIYQSWATNGGAVYNSGRLTVTNSTLISNTATSGGAIFNAAGATVKINHATLAANTGGSIHNANGAPTATSVAGTILLGSGDQCNGSLTNLGFNLVFGGACAELAPVSDLLPVDTGDPQLGPLRDNGGPTLTRAITAASSPAVIAGQPEAACTVKTDQRGRTRPLNASGNPGGMCDIGAVEFGAAKLTLCTNCAADTRAGRFLDLQAALNVAMAGDIISVKAGAYTGNFTLYKDVTLQHAGIDIAGLSQEEPLDVRAILQASELTVTEQKRLGIAAGTILTVTGYALNPSTGALESTTDVSVTLRGLTLRNGLSRSGGAIVNLGTLAIYTSTLAENAAINGYDGNGDIINDEAARAKGGAIYTSGSLMLERSTISGNISEHYGGAIYVDGTTSGPKARLDVRASTLADNQAVRLPDQHVVGVNDNAMLTSTLTVKAGDEIRFESQAGQKHTLRVDPDPDVTCQVPEIDVPVYGAGQSQPLICTPNSKTAPFQVKVFDKKNAAITMMIIVQDVNFVPEGHSVYAVGSSQSDFFSSILVKSTVLEANCDTSQRQISTFKSLGYNLANDKSCRGGDQHLDSDVDLEAKYTLSDLRLGPLQDNNSIDFRSRIVSGYTYAHALYPDSPAIDTIPSKHCLASASLPITIVPGSDISDTVGAGDTVIWKSSQATTVVFNDGKSSTRFVAVPAGGESEEVQFPQAGVYAYRVYDDVNRAEIAAGAITVTAGARTMDQRGLPLPQRGTTRLYNCDIGAIEFQPWTVGQPLPRPPAALGGQSPEWTGVQDISSYHLWSSATAQDFSLRPTFNNNDDQLEPSEMITVKWETSTDLQKNVKIEQVGIVEWPDDPQIHIAQVPVNLNHDRVADGYLVSAARAFEGRNPAENADSILSLEIFTRTLLPTTNPGADGDSYSVLQFTRETQASAALKVVVVKTVDWNRPGVRDMAAPGCTIGTTLSYPLHQDPEGRPGWILSGTAYDGVRTQADLVTVQNTVGNVTPPAHVRQDRTGPIIPILNQAPTTFSNPDLVTGGHDLRVAWYMSDERNIAWPVKAVGYRCNWPTNPPQIVIASELGSEIDDQPVLVADRFANPAVYHQIDAGQPGFSPNYEHALLSASNQGNPVPALYALRTDLFNRAPAVPITRSFALLKYQDLAEESQPKIALYEVVLTRTAEMILPTAVTVRPAGGNLPTGEKFTVPVELLGAQKVRSATVQITYDPAMLQLKSCLLNHLDWLQPADPFGCPVQPISQTGTLTLSLMTRNKHGMSGDLILADLTFTRTVGQGNLNSTAVRLAGPGYESLRFDITAGNPVFAPVPVRNLLDIQPCTQTTVFEPENALPFWKDYRGMVWARAAGDMDVLYFYPLQNGFYLSDELASRAGLVDKETKALSTAAQVGKCVPWLSELSANTRPITFTNPIRYTPPITQSQYLTITTRVLPVVYHVAWPALPALLSVGETVYQEAKGGISGVATQQAVSRIYDSGSPGSWNNAPDTQQIVFNGTLATRALTQLMAPTDEVTVSLDIKINGNFSLPVEIKTERRLYGGGLAIAGNKNELDLALPFSLRSRISYDDGKGELLFRGYYDATSPEYLKGDPLLLLNIMSLSDKERLQALCPGSGECKTYRDAIDALYWKTLNPQELDLCRTADGRLSVNDTGPTASGNRGVEKPGISTACPVLPDPANDDAYRTYRDGQPDQAFLIGLQDTEPDGIAEPYEGLGKGKALTAGNAAGTGYVTLAYNNDDSLGGLPISLQVIKVGCEENDQGELSAYRGNLLVIQSDNLFDEKLTLRHTGDFGGRPGNFTFQWWIAPVDDTGVSPAAIPPAYPWKQWTRLEPGTDSLGSEITIEGANPTTLSDNWLIVRYQNNNPNAACNSGARYSAFAGDPSAKPTEVRGQLAEGWIKRVTSALNPFDARVKDFENNPINTTVSMIQQAGPRYEGPVAMSNDPETLNQMGLIEAYQTVLERGRALSIDSNINDQGANAALLNVTTRIADLYMLLANDAYMDALDPTVGLGTTSSLGSRALDAFAFMNQFQASQFGLIDEELALLRGRDQTLGGVAAGPTYNRLTWNFTNGPGAVSYQQNYNIKDVNGDGFINEADGALMYPQGHGDAWGQFLTATTKYYELLRHPNYTWAPRAEPVAVAGAPVVVDYYDEHRFAIAAANKARMGVEIVDLTYRKHYADPASQPYIDTYVDASDSCTKQDDTGDCQQRAWGVADWAERTGQAALFDWVVANAILPPEDDRYSDLRKLDRTTVGELKEIAEQHAVVQKQLDRADRGANPLGMAPNAVLFDLDPSAGLTHFEQVYFNATEMLENAIKSFDNANEMKIALRDSQNSQIDFAHQIVDEDRALVNELIDLFGSPYSDDIGVNGTYPAGYIGPDIYNYDLTDRTTLTDFQKRCTPDEFQVGRCRPKTETYTVHYLAIDCVGYYVTYKTRDDVNTGRLCEPFARSPLGVQHIVGTGLDAGYGRVPPATWSGTRRVSGDITNRLFAVYTARANSELTITQYQNLVDEIVLAEQGIRDRVEVLNSEGAIQKNRTIIAGVIQGAVLALKSTAAIMKQLDEDAIQFSKATAECLPTSIGLSSDTTSPARCSVLFAGAAAGGVMNSLEFAATLAADLADFGLTHYDNIVQDQLFQKEADYEIRQMGRDFQNFLAQEKELRIQLFLAQDALASAQSDYLNAVETGFNKLRELSRKRQRWAGQISEERYGDMAYRTAQIDALQKYRQEFDLTQLYTYLAAVAYDYETNLRGDDPVSGEQFVRQIIGLRALGEVHYKEDGSVLWPVPSSHGLAGPMGQMRDNFFVLKGQMGFNNPQPDANRFSLRQELFRLHDTSDAKWRQELQRYYTPNIYSNNDVAQLAKRPFGESGPQPGLVIPFGSTIRDGQNFFGMPLGPGDNAYDASQFSTKIASVGIWFEGYDTSQLANTPRVYLLPAGNDVLRPRNTNGQLRYWNVAEQLLPLPYPITQADLQNPDWLARVNGLNGQLFATKPYARLRAYPYSAEMSPDELNTDTRLIGRAVWNTQWILVIPGATLLADPQVGIERFIQGVDDIYLSFQTYSYAGTRATARSQETAMTEAVSASPSAPAPTAARTSASASPQSLPLPDVLFYGTATENNELLEGGTVKAILPRGEVINVEVTPIQGTDYTYALAVPLSQYDPDLGADAASSARTGEPIRFLVNGMPAVFSAADGAITDQFTIPANGPGQPYRLDQALVSPQSYLPGDVNASGHRDSADALLVLKYDVGLAPGQTSFPPGPGAIYLPLCDMLENGKCDSGDALFILQCDVGMAGVSCPDTPLLAAMSPALGPSISVETALESAPAPVVTAPDSAAALGLELLLRSGSEPGLIELIVQVDVPIADGFAGLGAAALTVTYDPDLLELLTCQANPDDLLDLAGCNPAYAANSLRFNGISAAGLTGRDNLVQARFRLKAGDLASLPVDGIRLDQVSILDPAGETLDWRWVESSMDLPDGPPIPESEPGLESSPAPNWIYLPFLRAEAAPAPGRPAHLIYVPITGSE